MEGGFAKVVFKCECMVEMKHCSNPKSTEELYSLCLKPFGFALFNNQFDVLDTFFEQQIEAASDPDSLIQVKMQRVPPIVVSMLDSARGSFAQLDESRLPFKSRSAENSQRTRTTSRAS